MAYPEKILADDEEIVQRLHPHWITLVPAALWFVLVCAAAGVGISYAPDAGTGQLVVVVAIVVVGVVLLGWRSFAPWLRWSTTHYVFTTHRVLIRRGVFTHTGRDIALQRINDVGFSQSLWDRMVRAGTLTIESAGEHGQESLCNIPRSDQMQQALNRLIEADSERRARQDYGGGPRQQPYPPDYPTRGYPQHPPTEQYPLR